MALLNWDEDQERDGDIANLAELFFEADVSPARAERMAAAVVRLADEEN